MAMSEEIALTVLKIHDNTEHVKLGGKKDASNIAGVVDPDETLLDPARVGLTV